jgi:oligopeptide/dipeptide ABC transporter ATP-binding protein
MTSAVSPRPVPAAGETEGPSLLSIQGLRVEFATPRGVARVLTGVDLEVRRGEVVGLVGESGCGKSVTALAVLRLLRHPGRVTGGSVRFQGRELLTLPEAAMRQVRGRGIAMIFQAPRESLNPVLTIGRQLGLLLARHDGLTGGAAAARARELAEMVELPDPARVLRAYPHELSGGMCQRAMIALALACRPALLIADEATTALDVTVQLQILLLLRRLRETLGLAQLLITHNLGVVAEACQRVAVMYAGEIVETAGAGELFASPRHPYARRLLAARPRIGAPPEGDPIPGGVPDPIARPPGCPFHPRCHRAQAPCAERHPALEALAPGRAVRCHYPEPPAGGEPVPR